VDEDHEEATMMHARPLAFHAITQAALSVLAACGVEADRALSAPEAAPEAACEAAFLRALVGEDESAPGDEDWGLEWVTASCTGTRCLTAALDADDSEHQVPRLGKSVLDRGDDPNDD
jgi:hypothetical protein